VRKEGRGEGGREEGKKEEREGGRAEGCWNALTSLRSY